MTYMIAIDSGGTKTDTVLFDNTGCVLARDISPGANALDIGTKMSEQRIFEAIRRVAARAPGDIEAIYGGIAGVYHLGNYLYNFLRPRLQARSLRIDDDGPSLISGTIGAADGCGMVAGTGSSLFARIAGRPLVHIGGGGDLIDTGGSGFVLGQEALRVVFRSFDGRGDKTILTELLTRDLGDHPAKCMKKIYEGGRPFIASLAHNVFEGRRLGDKICCEIFDRCAWSLAELTLAAEEHFEGEFPVVMGGGLFSAFPEYAEAVRKLGSPRAKMIRAEVPPVYGAAVEEMWDVGLEPDENFKKRFLESYNSFVVKSR